MPQFPAHRLLLGLVLTLAGACLAIALFTVAVVGLQRESIEQDARIEAVHAAQGLALEAALRAGGPLQAWLERAAPLHDRDLEVIAPDRRVVAAVEPGARGQLYEADLGEELGRTLADGEPRAFLEARASGPGFAHRVAVPLHGAGGAGEPIVGALLLDYSDIREEFLRRAAWQQAVLVSIGLACMLLVAVPGWHLYRGFRHMADELRLGREQLLERMASERRAAQQVEHLAFHDPLTGLPNRARFSQRLEHVLGEAARRDRGVAVMFVDLDGFKSVNDTLGHGCGDALLKEVADRLRRALRTSDCVARLGGDEFVILADDVGDRETAAGLAAKLIALVADPIRLAGQDFRVTASVGISLYPHDGLDEPALMKQADAAMYQAKERGKNAFAFHAAQQEPPLPDGPAGLGPLLRLAFEHHQFEMHYEPRVSCRTGRVTGVQGLLRWRHPVLGLILPHRFIPVAEETGLAVPLGRWMVHEACAQLAAWRASALPPLRMAIRVSARQFAHEGLLDDLRAALAGTGAPPAGLELELGADALRADPRRARAVLGALRALSVRVSLDDFGPGESSLSILGGFAVDTLKVDRAIVRELTTPLANRAAAHAIVAMSRTLGLHVVAEGVETAVQAAILGEQGCDEIQGFFCGRPLPPAELEALLARPCAALPG